MLNHILGVFQKSKNILKLSACVESSRSSGNSCYSHVESYRGNFSKSEKYPEIQVSLLLNGHFADNTSPDCMKAPQSLMPYIYSKAVVFNKFYQVKNCHEFVVLDCALYPNLNGHRGRIKSFNHQNGQYIVTVNMIQFNSPSSPSSLVMQSCPHYMEPLVKVKKFGITNAATLQSKEVVSLWNTLCASDTTTPHITIKFHSKLFELMTKRYIKPESTPNSWSINALWMIKPLLRTDKTGITGWRTPHSSTTLLPSKCHFGYLISHYSSQVGTWIILH